MTPKYKGFVFVFQINIFLNAKIFKYSNKRHKTKA